MPQIPIEVTSAVVSQPEIQAGPAGPIAHAFGQVTGANEDMASTGLQNIQVEGVIIRAQRHLKLLQAESGIKGDVDKAAEHFALQSDYETMQKDAETIGKELGEKYHKQYGGDSVLWESIQPHLQNEINMMKKGVFAKSIDLMTEEAKYQLNIHGETAARAWNDAQTEEEKARVSGDYDQKLSIAVSDGIATRTEAAKMIDTFLKRREEIEIISMVKSSDPEQVQRGIDALGEKGRYEHIDPEKLAVWKGMAESHLEQLNHRIETEDRANSVNLAIVAVEKDHTKDDGTLDTVASTKLLHSQQFMWDNNLLDKNGNPDRQKIEAIGSYIKSREEEQKQQERDQDEKAFDKYLPLADTNKLSVSQVDTLEIQGKISRHAASMLKREVIQNLKALKQEDRIGAEEKSLSLFGDLSSKIEAGEKLDPVKDIYGRMKDGLNWKHAQELVRMNGTKGSTDAGVKMGREMINRSPMFSVGTDEVRAEQGKLILKYNQFIKQHPEVTGEAAIDAAKKMLEPETRTFIGKILDKFGIGGGTKTKQEPEVSVPGKKSEAPTKAIQYLKQHPETKEQFKEFYGYLPEGM